MLMLSLSLLLRCQVRPREESPFHITTPTLLKGLIRAVNRLSFSLDDGGPQYNNTSKRTDASPSWHILSPRGNRKIYFHRNACNFRGIGLSVNVVIFPEREMDWQAELRLAVVGHMVSDIPRVL